MDFQQIQDRTLFVQNLKEGITQEDLYQIFISFGIIQLQQGKLKIQKYHQQKKIKGIAFIEYDEVDDCQEAIFNLDQSELFGKVIVCKKPKRYKEDRNIPVWEQPNYNEQQAKNDETPEQN